MNFQSSGKTTALARVFGCDVRSLAVFRIALGLIVLADVILRSSTIEAMYTDAGFFDGEFWAAHAAEMEGTKDAIGWSVHRWFGGYWWQALLMAITGCAGVALAIGFQTRIATIICWVLVSSIQASNPIILTSGDTLLKLILFWSMFLPLGYVWSWDAKRINDRQRSRYRNWPWIATAATAGLIMQIVYMYFFTGFSKCNEYWFSGIAMDYVLRLDIYATDLGKWMLNFPGLLKVICWLTVFGELLIPLLLFSPWHNAKIRMFAMAVFWSLHIGIALCMSIGLFSYISMIAWFAILPTEFWKFSWVSRTIARIPIRSAQSRQEEPREWFFWPVQTLCVFFIFYFGLWNVSNIYRFQSLMPSELYFVGKYTNTKQAFQMFDVPPLLSPWFVYEAELADGTQIDIFRNAPVTHDHPDSVRRTISGHHWRRLHRNLSRDKFRKFREPVAEYMVRQWNEAHPSFKQIRYMKLTAYLDEIGPEYNGTDRRAQVWMVYATDDADKRRVFDEAFEKAKSGEILP